MKVIKKITPKNKIKKFDFVKPPYYFSPMRHIVRLVSKIVLHGSDLEICRINMEGLKPPYLMLANHASILDMATSAIVNHPHRMYNVVAIDGLYQFTEPLLRSIGTIAKRKFVKDSNLIKNMKYAVTKCKDAILVMYPEAKYSLQGATSYLPPALGKLAKFLGVPVVSLHLSGCYVNSPQWRNIPVKRPKIQATVTQTATVEDVKNLPESELQNKIVKNFVYDDFKWQKQSNYKISLPDRAEHLNRLLYKCPHCSAAHQMRGEGSTLSCDSCGKVWEMTELGEMKALSGETEFPHIPDWFDWQREDIARRVRAGSYRFEDEVTVRTMPNAQKMYCQPNGRLIHDNTGFTFIGNIYGEDVTVHLDAKTQDGVHIEYAKKLTGFMDAVILHTKDESYWLMPLNAKDVITEISLANDCIYEMLNQPDEN